MALLPDVSSDPVVWLGYVGHYWLFGVVFHRDILKCARIDAIYQLDKLLLEWNCGGAQRMISLG